MRHGALDLLTASSIGSLPTRSRSMPRVRRLRPVEGLWSVVSACSSGLLRRAGQALFLVSASLAIVLEGAGCGSGTASAGTPPAQPQVTISGAGEVRLGSTAQLVATVTNSSSSAVTWQVNGTPGGSNALGTISSTGVYTPPASIPTPNTVTISAVADVVSDGKCSGDGVHRQSSAGGCERDGERECRGNVRAAGCDGLRIRVGRTVAGRRNGVDDDVCFAYGTAGHSAGCGGCDLTCDQRSESEPWERDGDGDCAGHGS